MTFTSSSLNNLYEYVDSHGHRYIVGDDVISVTRRNLERHMGINRYSNELYQFLVAAALAKLGISKGTVDLTVFAPPGIYTQAKEIMLERLSENGKKIEIKLRGTRSRVFGSMRPSPSGRKGWGRQPASSSMTRAI